MEIKIPVYIFSGLCADERMFQHIHFPNYAEVHHVKWEKPLKKESLDHYIDRLLEKFDLSKPIVLIGLSFGGIVVQEVAKKIKTHRVIIISSITSWRELPWYFRLCGYLRLNRVTPFRFLRRANVFVQGIFGTKTKESQQLLQAYSRESDIELLKWSVAQILAWRSENPPANLFHIHGSRDRLLPLKNKNVDAVIPGVGHFMVFEHAEMIEPVLKGELLRVIDVEVARVELVEAFINLLKEGKSE